MDIFHNRYQLLEPWLKSGDGWLTTARDPKLSREVLLWRTTVLNDREKEECLRRLSAAARFSHRRFVHILDVSVDENQVYAVLTKGEGSRLADRVHALDWNGYEIVARLRDLTGPIREARRERLQDFAVTADNLWLDGTGRLLVINYWTEAEVKERDVYGLAMLLYQLCAKRRELPSSIKEFNDAVALGLSGLPGGGPGEAAEWAGSAFLPSCTLREFEAGMTRLLEEPAAPAGGQDMHESASQQRLRTQRSRPEAPKREKPAAFVPVNEEEEEEETEGGLKPWFWFTAIVFMVGFLAVMGIWFVTRSPGKAAAPSSPPVTATPSSAPGASAAPEDGSPSPEASASPNAASPSQAASASPAASPTPAATVQAPQPSSTPQPAASQEPAAPEETEKTVPNLVNRTLEEASQLALEAGLRYEYRIEPNDLAEGLVFRQDLTPGDPVVKGDKIMFWVSKGRQ